MTSMTGHGYLLTTSWTQLMIGLDGETLWLKHPSVHLNDHLGQGIDDDDESMKHPSVHPNDRLGQRH